LLAVIRARIETEPFNAFAAAIFLPAIAHACVASWFTAATHRLQERHDARLDRAGRSRHKPRVRGGQR
jgi:hypothetical protein